MGKCKGAKATMGKHRKRYVGWQSEIKKGRLQTLSGGQRKKARGGGIGK